MVIPMAIVTTLAALLNPVSGRAAATEKGLEALPLADLFAMLRTGGSRCARNPSGRLFARRGLSRHEVADTVDGSLRPAYPFVNEEHAVDARLVKAYRGPDGPHLR